MKRGHRSPVLYLQRTPFPQYWTTQVWSERTYQQQQHTLTTNPNSVQRHRQRLSQMRTTHHRILPIPRLSTLCRVVRNPLCHPGFYQAEVEYWSHRRRQQRRGNRKLHREGSHSHHRTLQMAVCREDSAPYHPYDSPCVSPTLRPSQRR